MRSLMLKLLTITVILSSSIFANTTDKSVLNYERHRINTNPNIMLKNLSIYFKKNLKNGWTGYALDIKLTVMPQHKTVNIKDVVFTDGKVITQDLKNLKNGFDFKSIMMPTLSNKYYKKENFIAGNINAKHKLVVFSDPLCPFCIENLPKAYKAVSKSKNIAMYYYDFPLLGLHPASDVITRYLTIAKTKNVKDLIYKVYTANFEKYFKISQRDPKKIVPVLNKVFGLNISIKETMSKKVFKELQEEVKMGEDAMVRGTPTIFFDGKYDKTREKFKKYLK